MVYNKVSERTDIMEEIKKPEVKAPRTRRTVYNMVYTAMLTAIICVCSVISIPVGDVPITLQTFAVCAAAGMLGWKRGTISVIIYILLGTVGLPVFQGLTGGPGVLAGKTGGYIVGFILTALIVGIVSDLSRRKMLPLILSMAAGVLACYAVGTPWFMFVTGLGFEVSLGYCVIPFLIPDAVKIALAAMLVNRLSKVLPEKLQQNK